jgi:hypothetical protein
LTWENAHQQDYPLGGTLGAQRSFQHTGAEALGDGGALGGGGSQNLTTQIGPIAAEYRKLPSGFSAPLTG